MTILELEMAATSAAIKMIGYSMAGGFLDINDETESQWQIAMTALLSANESKRRIQEKCKKER